MVKVTTNRKLEEGENGAKIKLSLIKPATEYSAEQTLGTPLEIPISNDQTLAPSKEMATLSIDDTRSYNYQWLIENPKQFFLETIQNQVDLEDYNAGEYLYRITIEEKKGKKVTGLYFHCLRERKT